MFSISLVSILVPAFKGEFKQSIKISVEMYMAAVLNINLLSIMTKIKVSSSFFPVKNIEKLWSLANGKQSYYAFGRSPPMGVGWFAATTTTGLAATTTPLWNVTFCRLIFIFSIFFSVLAA